MDWCKDGIPTAIQQAKTKGLIFLVYISGVDDLSKKMDETWEISSVADTCKGSCIAIKLEAKSTECVQFSEIYPVVCVPSTFLIGTDGMPVEILGGYYEAEDFISKLNGVLQKTKLPSVTAEESAPDTSENKSSPDETESTRDASPCREAPCSPTTSSAEDVGTADVTAEPPAGGTDSQQAGGGGEADGTAETEVELQAKVQRTQELIAQKRERKAKETEEKQRNEEIQRRNLGKDAAKLKQWQEEKNQEDMVKNWKKEKEEAKLAKQRVKEQIARDRAERAAKFQKDKEERQELLETKKRQAEEQEAQNKARTEAMKRETARLQFRLPDGSNITETFASSETLGTAKIFLNAKVGDAYGNYTLRTTYPKREFSSEHMSSTLLDLELAPSAALVVIPGSKMSSSFLGGESGHKSNDSGGILMLILSPLILLWNFICNLIFGAPATSPQRDIPPQAESSPAESSTSPTPSQEEESSALRNRSKVLKSGLNSRQEGNVRRFTANPEDDDMTVYNGNSTQQM